ncbi:AlpA family transcriptional regulator [Luteimonas cucumeris]|uniref:AlpA family transcriptional regulator n=1 Tax=Luteimonas cucumeris TaxID=985012 RepID=A0A562LB74_9GAMM|nr:hypothetical protein [Luteimonas cucumeris]TWI04858.1 AlpA family transcriptional regulator [Luteimonas cucumeris]
MSDNTLAIIAAVVTGDRWLTADACAVYLGMVTPKGEPNRRGFLERIACKPSFPKPLVLGNQKSWKKSEVDQWAEDERRISRAA